MAVYSPDMRCCMCDQVPRNPNDGYYNRGDIYINEPPVRDPGQSLCPCLPRNDRPQPVHMAPERDIPMESRNYNFPGIPNYPVGPPPSQPPTNGMYSCPCPPSNWAQPMQRRRRRKLCYNGCSGCCKPRRRVPGNQYNAMQGYYNTPVNSPPPMMSTTYYSQQYEPKPVVQDVGCNCSGNQTMNNDNLNCHKSRRRQKVSSSSSDGCMCNRDEDDSNEGEQNNVYPGMGTFFNPMCCPCQQMACPCLQDVCCACAQNLQQSCLQNHAKSTKVKKKKKPCKCNCTQTKCESKDKAVVTNLVQVSDACVCCKPKEKSTKSQKPKSTRKVCCICKQSITCPGKCCPCMIPRMCCCCCPCDAQTKGNNKESENESGTDTSKSRDKKRNKKDNKKAEISSDDVNVYNAKVAFPPNINILADILSKPTVSEKYKLNERFQNDKFSSPFTGFNYKMNLMKIRDPDLKKYKRFEPINVDDSINELMTAINQVKGDPEHRNLLTSVCDALLNNRLKGNSFEGGESSFLDQYTYSNSLNSFLCNTEPHNIGSRHQKAPRKTFANNFNNFTQTHQIMKFSEPNIRKININTQTNVTNPLTTTHSISDPINSYFNEETQAEVEELFEEYMKKIRYHKLFSNLKDGDCQVLNETKEIATDTFERKEDLTNLEDTIGECDILNNLQENKENQILPGVNKEEKPNTDVINETQNLLGTKREDASRTDLNDTVSEIDHNENKSIDNEPLKRHNTTFTKVKSSRPSTSCDGTSTNKPKHDVIRKYSSEHHCVNKVEDITKLSLRSPLNMKSYNQHDNTNIPSTALAARLEKKQMKRPSASGDKNSKKRKLLPTTPLTKCKEDIKYDGITKLKSKLPVISRSKNVSEKVCIVKMNEINNISANPRDFDAESSARINPKIKDMVPSLNKPYPCSSNQMDEICEEPPRKNEISENYNSHTKRDNVPKNVPFDRYFKPNDSDNVLKNSISNIEIMLSNVRYDGDDNTNVETMSYGQDSFDFDQFSLSSENQKSTLSIIKEETESDVIINKTLFNIEKYLDTCTSPFDFEVPCQNYVDSCNSPYEMKKAKEKKMSLGFLCFSSNDKDSEPYKAAGSSSSSEVEKPKSREKHWFF